MVLKNLRMGVIEIDDIVDDDMLAMARLYVRMKRLQQEIARLEEGSKARKSQQAEGWLGVDG